MAIGYTELDFINNTAPALNAANMNHIDEGVKACADALDLETVAGKAMTQAADATAQRTLLNVEDGADVTDEANVTAIENATAEVTAAPAHWNVLVAGAKKRLTHAGFAAIVKAFFGFVANAVGFQFSGGTTPKTLTVDEDATISTLTANKLAAAIEGGTATTTPLDTSIVPGVKADHSRLYYTWANIWAWVIGKIEGGAATATPADTDIVPSISAAHAAQKSTWAQFKAAIVAGVKATAANIVTGTSDLLFMTVKGLRDAADLAGFWLTKRTKMPDGATAVYSQDAWATTDSCVQANSTLSVVTTPGVLRSTSDGSAISGVRRDIAGIMGKTIILRLRASKTLSLYLLNYGTTFGGLVISATTAWQNVIFTIPADPAWTGWYIRSVSSAMANGDWFEIDWLWIGDYSYLPGSLSEEAARIANLRGDMPGGGINASQTITATDLATATKGDTIGGKKYTYVAALTASPGVEGEILKEATKEAELENLNLAISEAARTNNGTKYWAAAVHPLVSSARVNEVLTLTAKTKNGTENAIAVVCESGTNHTAGGATLLGGYTDADAKTIAGIQNNIAGSGTRPAAAKIELTNTALIGYETTVDVASGATFTLPAGGTWYWNVYGYGATIGSAKRGSSAGGTTLTVAGANASVGYRRTA